MHARAPRRPALALRRPIPQAGLLRVHAQDGAGADAPWSLSSEWRGGGGSVACMAALPGGARVAVGGDGKDVVLYDVARGAELLRAKAPPKDWLGMYVKVYVASLSFLSAHTPDGLLAGGEKELRLFDFRAQRRAVRTIAFGEGVVGALCTSADGATAAAGTSHGQLAHFDIGTGKMLGVFKGCAGGVRSLSLHPRLPLLAATGLDRHVRVFNTRNRSQAAALYVKQMCTAVQWDTRGAAALTPQPATPAAEEGQPEAAGEAAPRVRPRKQKRTSAVIDAFAQDSARWRAGGAAPGGAEGAPAQKVTKLKKKKARAPKEEGQGLMLNVEC
jgi:hypothetical protein